MSGFRLRRADGDERHVVGYRYQAPPDGHPTFSSRHVPDALPKKVDLRPLLTAIEDQGQTNSCAANATAGAYEYLMKRHLADEACDVSRLFIYFNARAMDGAESEDEGTALASVIEGLKQHGACSEETWPFDPARVNEAPPDHAFEEGRRFLVEDTSLVPTELDVWRGALASGHPIIFGLKLFGSFDQQRRAGHVPMPTPAEGQRESHGGHAMLCVGYSDRDEVFIVRNSWGPGWGDKGYCYVPYRYLMSEDYNYGDSWVIGRIEAVAPDEDTWSEGDESVLEDVANALVRMDEAAYAALLDAMGETPFELRLALLFARATGADGAIGPEEIAEIGGYLEPVFQALGVRLDAERVLDQALGVVEDEALLEESVALFGQHLPPEVLADIAQKLEAAASADGLSEEEAEFVDGVVQAWQIQ